MYWQNTGDVGAQLTRMIDRMTLQPRALVIQVALDGSGSVDRSRYVAYGGIAGSGATWGALHETWVEILNRHGLDYLRMTEAMNWAEPWWSEKAREWGSDRVARRDAILAECVAAAQRHRLFAVGIGADVRHLRRPEQLVAKKRTLFQAVLLDLLKQLKPEHTLALMCDDEQDAAMEFYGFVNSTRKSYPDLGSKIAGICFLDDRQVTQLQLADMVAWLLRTDTERAAERPTEPRSELLVTLGQRSTLKTAFTVEGNLIGPPDD